MKLLYCNNCKDIFNLKVNVEKYCSCGETHGQYVNGLNAEFQGKPAIPLGFDNHSFLFAKVTFGGDFTAFIIPEPCKTFKRLGA